MMIVRERFEDVRKRVADAAVRSGRRPEDVLIVAVTKGAAIEQVREIIDAGHGDLGESRVNSLAQRVAVIEEYLERHRTMTSTRQATPPPKVRWHLIGTLQRNKVKKALEYAHLIHSVDTLRLAEEIQDRAVGRDRPAEILLQVNASHEKQKHGFPIAAAVHVAEQIDSMINLKLRGLMTMGPLSEDAVRTRAAFEQAREVFDEIRRAGIGGGDFNLLSMGMSGDFETAIECGANVVRIGSAIFGPTQDDEDQEED